MSSLVMFSKGADAMHELRDLEADRGPREVPHGAVDPRDFDIVSIEAFPISVRLNDGSTLAIGRAIKRDAVVVKVTTRCGVIGYGEAHHGRAADVVAHVVNTTIRDIVGPACALDVVAIWDKIYAWQLRSHGLGAATVIAMSGLDMALWDIRAKAVGWPLYRLLGGSGVDVDAYAGGVALGWQAPQDLVEEAEPLVAAGYKAVKLRVGESAAKDIARVRAVREQFGDDLTIMVDANTGYSTEDVRTVAPVFEDLGVAWLEEPFPANDYRSYRTAARHTRIPLAAGENHYTRFEFVRLIEDGSVAMLQPDVAKAGGITETMRIASLASAWKLQISPHSSVTGLSQAATVHLLMSVDNGRYFEADVTPSNPFREELTSSPYAISPGGTVRMSDRPGLGVEVDESFIAAHPYIEGPNFV
jgi:L-alanine-DL-glutamate epimerase-like enolase superfamily enzyme